MTIQRLEENREILRQHLIPLHTDKDNNNLYVRFVELMDDYDTKKFINDNWEKVDQVITLKKEERDMLLDFVKDIATNYDCDIDTHRYNTSCRCCDANNILSKLK